MINVEKGTCKTCVHCSICKYQDDFANLTNRASELNSYVNTEHYEISVRCKHYRLCSENKNGIAERRN